MPWTKFQCEIYFWTRPPLIVMKQSSVSNAHKSMSSRILCCASERLFKNRVAGARSEKSNKDYDAINGESTEFEWNIFPEFTTLQLCDKINDLLSYLGQTPESFTGRTLLMSMFNWHLLRQKIQQKWMLGKCRSRESTCEKIWYWPMVIYWTRFCLSQKTF